MTDADTTNRPLHGVLLHVLDLPRQKAFYRDVVGLGTPVADSNFWVQFALPGNGMLILEKCNSVEPNADRHEISWLLPSQNYGEMLSRFEGESVRTVHPGTRLPGIQATTFADPEGNPFTIYALPTAATDR